METMELLKLAGIILVSIFILKFIWNIAKGSIKLIVAVILIAVGTYLYDKELVYGLIGKDNTETLIKEAKIGLSKVNDAASEVVNDAATDATDAAKEKGKELIDTVTIKD